MVGFKWAIMHASGSGGGCVDLNEAPEASYSQDRTN